MLVPNRRASSEQLRQLDGRNGTDRDGRRTRRAGRRSASPRRRATRAGPGPAEVSAFGRPMAEDTVVRYRSLCRRAHVVSTDQSVPTWNTASSSALRRTAASGHPATSPVLWGDSHRKTVAGDAVAPGAPARHPRHPHRAVVTRAEHIQLIVALVERRPGGRPTVRSQPASPAPAHHGRRRRHATPPSPLPTSSTPHHRHATQNTSS